MPTLTASQAVAGLTGAGYKCGTDTPYAICKAGPVAVWVLTGNHPRPPVVSLQAAGQAPAATAAIGKDLPKALELVHVNERRQIVDWFGGLGGSTAAQTTIGDWRVEWSAEVDTEQPGAHLTLMDTRCKVNCQTE